MIEKTSSRRILLLAAIHVFAGLILGSSGLFLSRVSYLSMWGLWMATGLIAWANRGTRHVTLLLVVVDSATVATAFLILPGAVA